MILDCAHLNTLSLSNFAIGSATGRDKREEMAGGGEEEKPGKGYPEMLGDFLREAGVLIGVFGFLDRVFHTAAPGDPSLTLWGLSVAGACIGFTWLGMWIEHRRGR